MYREYGGDKRGKKVLGEISGKVCKKECDFSALFKGKLFAPMCFEGTCDTRLFNVWLKQMLLPNLIPGQVLILDNASFHKSIESQRLVESAGCKILFLPAYSPDLNRKILGKYEEKSQRIIAQSSKFYRSIR